MKNLIVILLLIIVATALAQSTKTDTTTLDFGTRIYDARMNRCICPFLKKDTSQMNPYFFADSMKINNPILP